MSQLILNNQASSPDTPASAKIKIYTKTDKNIYIKDDTGLETKLNLPSAANGSDKSITIEGPSASEDASIFFTSVALTITEMRAVLIGSSTPSVTWTIRHAADRSAAGNEVVTGGTTTTSTTTGSDITSFNDATIPADSFVWIETTAMSGTVNELSVSIIYTYD